MDGSKSSNGIGRTVNVPASPTVSVLMPVYNGERYLQSSIESILGQTYSDFEFLIIDDGSTDRTQNIIRGYDDPRIRLIENGHNIGLTKSLNKGLTLARGRLIARQDADDISFPTRLEIQKQILWEQPNVVLLGAQARVIGSNGRTLFAHTSMPLDSLSIRWRLMFSNPFLHSSVMFRRCVVLEKMGGYDGRYRLAQDFELWSRLAQQHEVANLPDILIAYRKHPNSTGFGQMAPAELISLNLARYSGFHNSPSAWTALIKSLHVGNFTEPQQLLDLFDILFRSYCAQQNEIDAETRLRPHLARLYGLVAYKLAMVNQRVDSIRVFSQATSIDPKILKNGLDYNMSTLKYFGRWIGGSTIEKIK